MARPVNRPVIVCADTHRGRPTIIKDKCMRPPSRIGSSEIPSRHVGMYAWNFRHQYSMKRDPHWTDVICKRKHCTSDDPRGQARGVPRCATTYYRFWLYYGHLRNVFHALAACFQLWRCGIKGTNIHGVSVHQVIVVRLVFVTAHSAVPQISNTRQFRSNFILQRLHSILRTITQVRFNDSHGEAARTGLFAPRHSRGSPSQRHS